MRRITAEWIFTLAGPPVRNGVITLDNEGTIVQIETEKDKKLLSPAENYEGILVPGFINTHFHLELSHLKGITERKKGIAHFVGEIHRKRNAPEEIVMEAALQMDRHLYHQGIAGVGDISNTAVTADIKKNSRINYFSFVETFGFHPSRAERAIQAAREIKRKFSGYSLPASIVPHAPYSVSSLLFKEIRALAATDCSIISMHNQESREENIFFRTGKGPLMDHITDTLGLDATGWKPTGKNSLESVLPELPSGRPLLLVHNTYTTGEDILALKRHWSEKETFFVICPNSNLYIEDHLPPVNLFRDEKLRICLGTDSPASNDSNSVLEEMITLHHYFPAIPLGELLEWACVNGAEALGMEQHLGTLEEGKKPGIVLISGMDPQTGHLAPGSKAQRIA